MDNPNNRNAERDAQGEYASDNVSGRSAAAVKTKRRPNSGNFANDPERARAAGRKGGEASGGNFARDPERARAAGRKGGMASHSNSAARRATRAQNENSDRVKSDQVIDSDRMLDDAEMDKQAREAMHAARRTSTGDGSHGRV